MRFPPYQFLGSCKRSSFRRFHGSLNFVYVFDDTLLFLSLWRSFCRSGRLTCAPVQWEVVCRVQAFVRGALSVMFFILCLCVRACPQLSKLCQKTSDAPRVLCAALFRSTILLSHGLSVVYPNPAAWLHDSR